MKAAAVLAVLVLMLTPGRAPGQSIHARARPINVSEDYAGFTTCISTPVAWVRTDLAPKEAGAVRAHEAAHVAHMATFPSCEAYFVWRDSAWANQIEAEARAFCAGAKFDFANKIATSWMAAVWQHSMVFALYWNSPAWNHSAAVAAILHVCVP